MKPTNPFITKGYIAKEYFCDREQETRLLLDAIKNGRDLVLYGRRKQGKSALIKHVFAQLDKKYITIWIDLLPTESFSDLLNQTASALLRAFEEDTSIGKKLWSGIKKLRPTINYDEFSGQPNITFDINDEKIQLSTFSDIIGLISSITKNVVIAFDEFQQINNYKEENTEAYLRTLLQSISNLSVIFSGSDQHMLLQMFDNVDRPFYNFGQYLKLDHIDAKVYSVFIQNHFSNGKKKIDEDIIDELLKWSDYRTYNVQLTFNRLYSVSNRTVTTQNVKEVKTALLKEREDVNYMLRRIISKGQWQVIEAFAKEGKIYEPYGKEFMQKYGFSNSSTIRRAVKSCTEKGLIYKGVEEGKEYFEIDDVLLSRWIQVTML